MERAVNFTRKMGLQRLINTLGEAINESCKKLDCKRANHSHFPDALRLIPGGKKRDGEKNG